MKINLGCGQKYLAGYINTDVLPRVKADRHFDLNLVPYPFESGSAEEIFMDNVLEHLDDIPKVMAELHRILKPGGRLRILVPYGKTDWAMQDPTHKHFFTENSLNYFVEGHPYNFYTDIRFKLHQAKLYCDHTNILHKLRNLLPFKKYLRYFFFNIYDGIYFELEKTAPLTDQPPAGSPGASH
jgi:SAM-dependent methyltransferase